MSVKQDLAVYASMSIMAGISTPYAMIPTSCTQIRKLSNNKQSFRRFTYFDVRSLFSVLRRYSSTSFPLRLPVSLRLTGS